MNTKRLLDYLSKKSFNDHLVASILIRLLLIIYGQIHDTFSEVPYTDIDYKVVTDGARHMLEGESPFLRHTYRYSPLLAVLQTPAVLVHPLVGKCIYSLFDILVAVLIYKIVSNELSFQRLEVLATIYDENKELLKGSFSKNIIPNVQEEMPKYSAIIWLYNPIAMVISTRGNGDSFSSFFVLLTIYYISIRNKSGLDVFLAGLSHGLAVHLRLYPILFSLSLYLSLSTAPSTNISPFCKQIFKPSKQQICLVLGTVISLTVFTGYFYLQYGWQYIYEAYLYHLVRKDVRHNFSLYFLMQYLSGDAASTLFEKLLITLPKLVLIIYLTFAFGQFRATLPFCIFAQTFVAVTYNSVVTSQYFVWYLALFPLCVMNLKTMPLRTTVLYFIMWLLSQGMWLLPAYLLEFKAWNTFNWIGMQAILFFLMNIFLLSRLMEHFDYHRHLSKMREVFYSKIN